MTTSERLDGIERIICWPIRLPERADALESLAALREHYREIGEQFEFDRSAVADCVSAANRAIDGRHWLTEGRGPYEWDDDKWHEEFYAAAVEIRGALAPLTKIAANWKDCPQSGDDVAKARIDLKAELAALREQVAEMEQRDSTLRRRIHQLDRHNQFFERCESTWCHPSPSRPFHGDPASEPFGLAWKSPAEYDEQIATLTAERDQARRVTFRLDGELLEAERMLRGGVSPLSVANTIQSARAALSTAAPTPQLEERVAEWVRTRIGPEYMHSRERAMRLFEESVELAQSEGISFKQLQAQVLHVFGRPTGEPLQEAAGVAVCLLAWCSARGLRFVNLAIAEIERIEAKPLDQIRGSLARKADADLVTTAAPKRSAWTDYMQSEAGREEYAAVERSLLRPVNEPLPEGCHCQPGKCAAPVIMGRQIPCRDPLKAATLAPAPPVCARCKGTHYINEKRWPTYETDTAEERADARQRGACPDCAVPTAKEPQ